LQFWRIKECRFHQLSVGDKVELEMDSDSELRIRPKELPTLKEHTNNEG